MNSQEFPEPRTPFVGRERELHKALRQLTERHVRLLTVTGRPGAGKTRFGIEVARITGSRMLFVQTSGRLDGEQVVAAIHESLNPRQGSATTWSSMVRALDRTPTLILLDDAGRESVPIVTRLLTDSAQVVVLATAAAPLRVDGEFVVRLGPLDVAPAGVTDAAAIAESPAERLFVEIAGGVSGFELDPTNAPVVAEICRQADGMPLAIELIAARTALLSADGILTALDQHRASEVVGDRVDASLERTYHLLSTSQQRLLRAMTPFAGPASIDAVHAVCGGHDLAQTIDDLSELVDVHVVEPGASPSTRDRFQLWPTVRKFAVRHAEAEGERAELDRRHADHFAKLARRRAAASGTHAREPQGHPGERLDMLQALEVVRDHDPVRALQFAVDLAPGLLGRYDDGPTSDLLAALLEAASGADAALRAEATAWQAHIAAATTYPPDRHAITARVREAVELLPPTGSDSARIRVVMLVGRLLTFVDDVELLRRAIDEGLAITAGRPDDPDRARLLTLSAVVTHASGDPAGAARLAAEVLDRSRWTSDDRARMRASLVLLGISRRLHPPGVHHLDPAETVALARRVGDTQDLAAALATLASSQMRGGDSGGGAATTAEMLEMAIVAGDVAAQALAITLLSGIAAGRGDHETAVRFDEILDAADGTFDAAIPPGLRAGYLAMMQRSRDALGTADAAGAEATARRWGWSDAVAAALEYCHAVARESQEAVGSPRARRARGGGTAPKRMPALTDRQVQVLELLAQGATNKTIATTLGVRPKTVMHHNEAIYRKLDVRGRAAAVSAAHRLGLIATGAATPQGV